MNGTLPGGRRRGRIWAGAVFAVLALAACQPSPRPPGEASSQARQPAAAEAGYPVAAAGASANGGSRPDAVPTTAPVTTPGHTLSTAPTNTPATAPTNTGDDSPVTDVAAMRGLGRLAFAWAGRLHVLDGEEGVLRELTESGRVTGPVWSADGQWLAFHWASEGRSGESVLTIMRADGSQTYRLPELSPGTYAWSPTDAVLAVAPAVPDQGNGVWLVRPGQEPRQVVSTENPVDLVWSRDGSALAYAMVLPFEDPVARSDALYILRLDEDEGQPVRVHTAPQAGIRLVGWWPDGEGLLFWRNSQHSASLAADGMPLMSLPLATGEPQQLATALGYRGWLSWSPDGQHLLLVQGEGREAWTNKILTRCDVRTGACQPLSQPAGSVSLDPAWSPRGDRIALVRVAEPVEYPSGAAQLEAWARTRTLWVAEPDGTGARQLEQAGVGVYRPTWAWDGSHLLFVRDNALWVVEVDGDGPPVKVLGPFPDRHDSLGYYGHMDWRNLVLWDGRR